LAFKSGIKSVGMTQLYTPLFSFHLIIAQKPFGNKKQTSRVDMASSDILPKISPKIQSDTTPLFEAQRQFMDFIEQLSLFCPCPQTLKNILAYGSDKLKEGILEKEKDDNNYDPQTALSVCN